MAGTRRRGQKVCEMGLILYTKWVTNSTIHRQKRVCVAESETIARFTSVTLIFRGLLGAAEIARLKQGEQEMCTIVTLQRLRTEYRQVEYFDSTF